MEYYLGKEHKMAHRKNYSQKGIPRSRNLDNLHVIPTSSKIHEIPEENQGFDLSPLQPNLSTASAPPSKKKKKYDEYAISAAQYQKNLKSRTRSKARASQWRQEQLALMHMEMENNSYHWYNPNYVNDVMLYQNTYTPKKKFKKNFKPFWKKAKKAQQDTGTPAEESYFEEVEAFSLESEKSRETPVGFRKSKVYYLKSRRNCFFKPKIYRISKERTVVSCVNSQYNISADGDMDIVSEAEYEVDAEAEKSNTAESPSNLVEVIEIEDDDDNDNETSITEPNKLSEKIKTDTSESANKLTEEKVQESCEMKSTNVIEVIDIGDDSEDEFESQALQTRKCPSAFRQFKTCIEDTPDLHQTKSLNQEYFDSWKSHLIGLDYLIEIQNKGSVLKYYCVLCDEDITFGRYPGICVTNHISAYKHVVKYLENHFPSCGYRYAENSDLTENSDDNYVILQKICEEINKKDGYYFMCVTSNEDYEKRKQIMHSLILNAKHAAEDSVNIDVHLVKSTLDTIILNDVRDVLDGIIVDISSKDKEGKNSKTGSLKLSAGKPLISKDAKNKKYPVVKTSAVASFLKLKMADSKPKQPPKAKSKVLESTGVDNLKLNTQAASKNCVENAVKIDSLKSTNQITQKDLVKVDNTVKTDSSKSANQGIQKHSVEKGKIGSSKSVVKKSGAVSAFLKLKIASNRPNRLQEKKPVASNLSDKKENLNLDAVKKDTTSKTISSAFSCLGNQEQISSSSSAILKKKESPAEATSKGMFKVIKPTGKKVAVATPNAVLKVVKPIEKKVAVLKAVKPAEKKVAAAKATPQAVLKVVKVAEKKVMSKPVQKMANPVIYRRLGLKDNEKIVLNPTTHSKHCRKRILGNAISRLRGAAKTNSAEEPIINISFNESVKDVPVEQSVISETVSKSIVHMRKGEVMAKMSPLRKITPVKKTESHTKITTEGHSKGRRGLKYETEGVSGPLVPLKVKEYKQHRHSRSPHKRIFRRQSKSPVHRVFTSPIRVASLRRQSRSPVRRHRRSPVHKHSRSPLRRYSRSPARKFVRSPVKRLSRSPLRRHSRSPHRRHSRSPHRRLSRSPVRKHSRSPFGRHMRSPVKHQSRSPIRPHSRSPRRHSRSPRRHSRSPRRHSRSPVRRHSRSPVRKHSRSPARRYLRSPVRKVSRTPLRQHSSSTLRNLSRSPVRRHSRSPHFSDTLTRYKDSHRSRSPSPGISRMIEDHIDSFERYVNSKKRSIDSFTPGTSRDADFDPVSDEDESVYFNTADKLSHADSKTSLSASMFEKFFKKFATMDTNPNNVSMNRFMQFIEAHSAELQEMVGSERDLKSTKMNVAKVDSNIAERNSLLQQYLLSNLAGNISQPMASNAQFSQNMPPPFIPPPFVPNCPPPVIGHVPHMPTPDHLQSTINQPKIFPPNLNVPPPERFHQPHQGLPPPRPELSPRQQFNQPHHPSQNLMPRPKVPPEVMFKDLKATVNKLFGANEKPRRKEESVSNISPGFAMQPNPEKWDMGHSNAPKFSASSGPKSVFQSPEKKFHGIPGICEEEDVSMSFNSGPGRFLNNRGNDRPRLPVPPPDAKVSFCVVPSQSSKGNLFPVISSNVPGTSNMNSQSARGNVSDVKVSLAQRLASVLVKVGMIDVPAPLLQEMLMKIGAFSSSPPQDIREAEIVSILKRLGYLS